MGYGGRRSRARVRTYDVRTEGEEVLVGPRDEAQPGRGPNDDGQEWVVFDPERHLKNKRSD